MPLIPHNTLDLLGLPHTANTTDVMAALTNFPSSTERLLSDNVLTYLPALCADPVTGKGLDLTLSNIVIEQWGYFEVFDATVPLAQVLAIPRRNSPSIATPPATNAEKLLLEYCVWPTAIPAGLTLADALHNHVLIKWHTESRQLKHFFFARLGIFSHTTSPAPRPFNSLIIKAQKPLMASQSKYELQQLERAISEPTLAWKFMHYYKILEHGYLVCIFETLKGQFFSDPKLAVSTAEDSLASELKQLLRLIESHTLKTHFEEFRDKVEAISGNHYLAALRRRVDSRSKEGTSTREKFIKGAQYFYQIRCSIAHGGANSLIFDSYLDANDALRDLMPDIEKLIHDYLGLIFT